MTKENKDAGMDGSRSRPLWLHSAHSGFAQIMQLDSTAYTKESAQKRHWKVHFQRWGSGGKVFTAA